jgi:superoxide dismutase, Cu-Zn family
MSIHRMARSFLVGSGLVALVLAVGSGSVTAQGATTATAQVHDATGRQLGTATFTPAADGVAITASFQGITAPGQHGIHVHTTGACDPPDFMTAGEHFNPTNKQHGLDNPLGAHVGDLPNLDVAADGSARFSGVLHGATLGSGDASLLKSGGTALVIHQGMDDEMTDPAGNSGARIACGIVVAGAPAGGGAVQLPSGLPRTGGLDGVGVLIGAIGAIVALGGLALRRRR